MQCPSCGGEMWNNAAKNRERIAAGQKPMPLWACKDKEGCGKVIWPPKGESGPRKGGGFAPEPKHTWTSLDEMYGKALVVAAGQINRLAKANPAVKPTFADYLSAAACVFIEANRGGIKAAPKPAPEPEPEVEDDVEPY